MGDLLRFPPAEKTARVDAFADALTRANGPRELITYRVEPGAVAVFVAGVELWLTPDEAQEHAEDMLEMAADARAKAERSGL